MVDVKGGNSQPSSLHYISGSFGEKEDNHPVAPCNLLTVEAQPSDRLSKQSTGADPGVLLVG